MTPTTPADRNMDTPTSGARIRNAAPSSAPVTKLQAKTINNACQNHVALPGTEVPDGSFAISIES